MSENRIDVVAVLEVMRDAELEGGYPDVAHEIEQVRDAIAELIEADKEYNEARAAMEACDPRDQLLKKVANAAAIRLCYAIERRAAALARVTPELTKDSP